MQSHYHTLKTWPEHFFMVAAGIKTFEARKADRPFKTGDHLVLQEFEPESGYTGRSCSVVVTHMLTGGEFGIEPGHVVMSVRLDEVPADLPAA